MSVDLEWVGHAAYIAGNDEVRVLHDPWLTGSAFAGGWDLLTPAVLPQDALDRVTHVWISHEHPDHFSPESLRALRERMTNPPVYLFQTTEDDRVAAWLEREGFRVKRLQDRAWIDLAPGVSFVVGRHGPYDSWCALRTDGVTLLNLNDCPILDDDELTGIKVVVGAPDVLLTQFSFASWIGNPDDEAGIAERSQLQLRRLVRQTDVLQPTHVVPAASFVRFSNESNWHMNDHRVHPRTAAASAARAGAVPIVLYPGDRWVVGAPHDNTSVLARYDEALAVEHTPRTEPTVPLPELQRLASEYAARRAEGGSPVFARLAETLDKILPVTLRVDDLGETVVFHPRQGLEPAPAGARVEASMSSAMLAYVLRHDWGYDTLLVNGNFRTADGTKEATDRAFWLGAFNLTGRKIGPGFFGEAVGRRAGAVGALAARVAGPEQVVRAAARAPEGARRGAERLAARLGSRAAGITRTVSDSVTIERYLGGLPAVPGEVVPRRAEVYERAIARCGDEPVEYLEFGVWRGTSLRRFSAGLRHPDSVLHAFDSFEGLPENWTPDTPAGTFSTSGSLPTVHDDRVRFHVGWFSETLPSFTPVGGRRLVVNIDCDLYSSTVEVLGHVGPRLRARDLVYFDEFHLVDDEYRAWREFSDVHGVRVGLVARTPDRVHVLFEVLETA